MAFTKGNRFRFKPGQTGNPKGAPRRKWLTKILEQELQAKVPGREDGFTFAEALIRRWLQRAIQEADTFTIREILNRLEGRVPVQVQAEHHTTIEQKIPELTLAELKAIAAGRIPEHLLHLYAEDANEEEEAQGRKPS